MRSKKYKRQEELVDGKYIGKNPFVKLEYWYAERKTWQKVLMVLIALLIAAGLGAYAWFQQYMGSIATKIQDDEEIKENELSCVDIDGYANILLLGVDSRSMKKKALKAANSDAIMVVSMNEKTNKINLISVFRDTYLKMGDTITYEKINAAYAYGGAKMSMQSLNQAMDLNIKKYVLFNFKMVSDLVNEVGGITVYVREREIEQLNEYTKQTAKNIGQKKYRTVKKAGRQTLEGVQAVSFGRIRKGVGDDFRRTSRMRFVIKKVMAKLKKKNLFELKRIMEICLDDCKTNLSENDMIGMAQRLTKLDFSKTVGFPYTVKTGMLDGISYVFPGNLEESTVKLHKQMFAQDDYVASDKVKEISNTIISRVGAGGSESKDLGKYQEEIEAERKREEKRQAAKAKKAAEKAKQKQAAQAEQQ